MSEISSLPEDEQVHNPSTICPICSVEQKGIRPLKTHLLLKHPKVNLCLFCVEKKGWSDTFATQSSYNQHYKENHEGIIENKGKSLSEALILTSTNPQYDKRLFIDLSVHYIKTTSSEHVVYTNCFLF